MLPGKPYAAFSSSTSGAAHSSSPKLNLIFINFDALAARSTGTSMQLKPLHFVYIATAAASLRAMFKRFILSYFELQSSTEAPLQSFRLIRKFIPKHFQPWLRGLRKTLTRPSSLEQPYYSVYPYTQAALIRQQNLLRLAEEIDELDVPGAIIECGVLDGGTAALMAYGTVRSQRDVHLSNSWSGLPKSTVEDGQAAKKWVGEVVGSPKRVVSILRRLGIDLKRVTFHRGWFEDTFPILISVKWRCCTSMPISTNRLRFVSKNGIRI